MKNISQLKFVEDVPFGEGGTKTFLFWIYQIYKIIFVELWYFWCYIYIKYVIRFNIFLSEKKDFGFFVFCFVQCNNVLFIHIDFNIYF